VIPYVKPFVKYSAMMMFGVMITGCATWSTGEVVNMRAPIEKTAKVEPQAVIITESDIIEKPYIVLGDISVTVNKTTIFHPDPTKEMVNEKLKEEAVKLGADAILHVRYGTVGISMMSWGSLDGKGRAVQFTH
jgi:hypothetical protein